MSSRVESTILEDPPIAKKLFSDTRLAWLWLPIRIWLGWQWIDASEHKIMDPKWVDSGVALKGFFENAVRLEPKPVISFDWYRGFIQFMLDTQSYVWFAKLVAYGELLIGIALVLGAFTGFAAFFGAAMNWNFVMAGTASTNPLLLIVAIALMMAWKTAGWIGVDRYLLPMLGTPWQPGKFVKEHHLPHLGTPQPRAGS